MFFNLWKIILFHNFHLFDIISNYDISIIYETNSKRYMLQQSRFIAMNNINSITLYYQL